MSRPSIPSVPFNVLFQFSPLLNTVRERRAVILNRKQVELDTDQTRKQEVSSFKANMDTSAEEGRSP